MDRSRYYVSLTRSGYGYYSIIDRARRNEDGERFAVYSYLTRKEAEDLLATLTARESAERAS